MPRYLIAALYRFTPLTADSALQDRLKRLCEQHAVFGTLLLAPEGLNGTLAGPEDGLRAVLADLRKLPGCTELEHKESWADPSCG